MVQQDASVFRLQIGGTRLGQKIFPVDFKNADRRRVLTTEELRVNRRVEWGHLTYSASVKLRAKLLLHCGKFFSQNTWILFVWVKKIANQLHGEKYFLQDTESNKTEAIQK